MSYRRHEGEEAGVVAIVVALVTSFILFGVAALVVDLGLARDTRQASQVASDSSALAAATALYPDTSGTPNFVAAVAAAKLYAKKNFAVTDASWTGCTDAGAQSYRPDAADTCISFNSSTKPTKVRVRIPTRNVAGGFGQLYGVTTVPVSTSAGAVLTPASAGKCGLCFLGTVNTGNPDFTISGGSIAVSGSINAGPNSAWTATGAIGVSGTVSGGQFSPAVTPIPAFTDPLAGMAMPSWAGLHVFTNPCTQGPGIYGDYAIGSCTLTPGLYVIVGDWSEKNNSLLSNTIVSGQGVTLYFTCGTTAAPHVCTSADTTGGQLSGKNGAVAITAGATGFAGFALIYDRLNPEPISLQGNGQTEITGGIYAPNTTLTFNGGSCFGVNIGPVVAQSATGNGNQGCVTVSNSQDIGLKSAASQAYLNQ